jgi:diaminopimelate epimerase
MADLDVLLCSPSGNTTALVLDAVPRQHQVRAALHVLSSFPEVEQVGFVEVPEHGEARARLQMMGSELCGNGLCALAWHLHAADPGCTHFDLEVSGVEAAVPVEIDGPTVRVHLPVCADRGCITRRGEHILVQLEGILHVLVPGPPPARHRAAALDVIEAHRLADRHAVGVLFVHRTGRGVEMLPVVRIRSTNTVITQGGCGSGTLAVTFAEAWQQPAGRTRLDVLQPSGVSITAEISFDGSVFTDAWIQGRVELLGRHTVPGAVAEGGA